MHHNSIRFLVCLVALYGASVFASPAHPSPSGVGTVTVHYTPGHPANTFSPAQALGAGVDGYEQGDIDKIYTSANMEAMRSAGFQPLTYRLRTELGVEAWHWNPEGKWSEAGRQEGYWTSKSSTGTAILTSNGYRLPRRGSSVDQANNDGYSRLDDGDAKTFWKSNPYLDQRFTGEDNARHPQWVVVNLGKTRPINAVRIQWAIPFATRYRLDYWRGGADGDSDSISDTFGDGRWLPFPQGLETKGRGGDVLLRLAARPIRVRYVRLVMTQDSGRPPPGATDVRAGLGYAVREIGFGMQDRAGRFHDAVRHTPSGKRQTTIFTSSTDPWHQAADRDPLTEQPGFDRVLHSGLTNGLPLLTPVGMLYDTPDNAVGELRYLKARGYPVHEVEMGEEPDGQYASPEDYGALYIQYAEALHKVDPSLRLGGPGFQTDIEGWRTCPDARGNGSWMNRFVHYLRMRGHLQDFQFFSFEWYPFDNICGPTAPQLVQEPGLLSAAIERLHRQGLPLATPIYITEYGYSAFAGQAEVDLPGALLNADIVGQFLTLGGTRAYLYGYEPNSLIHEVTDCNTWGNLTLFLADDAGHIRYPMPTYYGARLLTQEWAQPSASHQTHAVYPAASDIHNAQGQPLVTSYAVRRPDGQWALLLVNKDPKQAHPVGVKFQNTETHTVSSWQGPVTVFQYSSAQYVWHAQGPHGYPMPDLPPSRRMTPSTIIRLPPYSFTVLRGRIAE